ncbi:Cna protein B-type domain-containing protein [Ruaniaceae bacterium KH17]|nr:Cna protein B-type domain-containing protein [Ruaniaceae bacterium KH17]
MHRGFTADGRVARWGPIGAVIAVILALILSNLAITPAAAVGSRVTGDVTTLDDSVLSGGRFSYQVRIECSSLEPENCTDVTFTMPAPKSADGQQATSPLVESTFVENSEVQGEDFVVFLKDLEPGTSVQFNISWALPNYTVVPGTTFTTTSKVGYSDPNGAPVEVPLDPPDAVTSLAEPKLNVGKSVVAPKDLTSIVPGSQVTYKITACVPNNELGQLPITSITFVDTFDSWADGAEHVIVVDADGGDVDYDAHTITWNETYTDPAFQACGSDQVITKTVTFEYPEGMLPEVPAGQTSASYPFKNQVDATATAQDGTVVSGHSEVGHTFSNFPKTPGLSVVATKSPWSANIPLDYDGEWHWFMQGYYTQGGKDYVDTNMRRDLALVERIPQVGASVTESPTGIGSGIEKYLFGPNAGNLTDWDNGGGGVPATRTTRIHLFGDGGTSQQARNMKNIKYIAVKYVNPDGTFGAAKWEAPEGGATEPVVYVYDTSRAQSIGIPEDALVTDIVAMWHNVPLGNNGGNAQKLEVYGTFTEAFRSSGQASMTNTQVTFASDQLDENGELPAAGSERDFVAGAMPAGARKPFTTAQYDFRITKAAVGKVNSLKPGDLVEWRIRWQTANTTVQGFRPKVVDLLPAGMTYVPGSMVWELGDHAAPTETIDVQVIDGVERTRITWQFGDDFLPQETVNGVMTAKVGFDAVAGSHSQPDTVQRVGIFDGDESRTGGTGSADKYDIDGDGDTTEIVNQATADWSVIAQSGATVEKFVKGSAGDGTWKREDVSYAELKHDSTEELSGTDVDYRIQVKNTTTRVQQNVVIYDILPHLGDTAIGESLAGEQRGSHFTVSFLQMLGSLPAGVTVQFNTSENPERGELFPEGQTGADSTPWLDELPDDPSTVRSLRIVVESLAVGEALNIDYRGTVPLFDFTLGAEQTCAASREDDTVKAWNNVAFRSQSVLSSGQLISLRPAEAPKVSIREICGQIGNLAWLDVDRNGLQDADEPPVPGVVFQLVDADGKDVVNSNGDPVRATTDENGHYSFDVPLGKWAVRVVEIPDNHRLTVPNSGDDNEKDSDAPGLGQVTEHVTIDGDNLINDTLDAGLVGLVSVGDYVWFDTDGNGRQDDGEPGIPDVWLSVLGPEGQPVVDEDGNPLRVSTDENGYYEFTGLPVLKDGERYTVVIDREASAAALEGMAPTLPNRGDREGDSDEWEATSEGLTKPGDRDSTLDFGFMSPNPGVDIEKFDENGNDADTKEESIPLSGGAAKLEFKVANLGSEDLVDIKVTDELIEGTGEITGLSCVFPDGTTGTTWNGPFLRGSSFDCAADLSGVEPGTTHVDLAKVEGAGRYSGKPVDDEDEYHGHTPKPSIDIEKVDLDGNDADTEDETVRTKKDSREIKMIITNTGAEALKDVSVTDEVTRGGAKVKNIDCTFPDGSTGTVWSGPLAVSDSFECTATVTGLGVDDLHVDNSTVKGTGVDSGLLVSDEDPYHVIRTGMLALTGSNGAGVVAGAVFSLMLVAAGVLLLRRRASTR